MKLSSVNRAIPASLLALACLSLLSFLPLNKVQAASAGAPNLPGTGKALVSLKSPQVLKFEYAGSPDAVAALESGSATPTALAEADFNADGAMDVVAGYATAKGGVLTLLRGNPDAFAPKDSSLYAKAMRGDVPATFLPRGVVYALPESPDLIVTGDFNRDGNQDVLVAARGGNLYLLAGDGKGHLAAPRVVSIAGPVGSMAATGDGHLAVSTDGEQGPEVRILAPGEAGLTVSARYPLPAQGDAVVWGALGGGNDLAVGAGSHIVIIYNPLKANAQSETVDLPFNVEGLTLGDFIWDRDGRTEMAALADDGTIYILQHGTLDSRALTAADMPGRRVAVMARARQHIDPTTLGAWNVAKKLPYAGPAPAGPVGPSAFSSPGLAAAETRDLMVLDGQRGVLNILDTSGKAASPSAGVSLSATLVAALTLPQKLDAGRDTLILTAGETDLWIVPEGPDPVFNVTTTSDTDAIGACGSGSGITSGGSPLSLRTAICEINNSGAGAYTVNLPAGTYSLSLNSFAGDNSNLSSPELQLGFISGQTITIAGAGAGSTIIQQTEGHSRILEVDPELVGSLPLTISNVTLQNGNCSTGLDCAVGGAAVIAGFATGDNLTLTNVTLSNNVAADLTDSGNYGGAVEFGGPTLTISGSKFTSNSTPTGTGGAGGQGGAVYFDSSLYPGNLSITNSTFTNNTVNSVSGSPDTYGGAAFVILASGNNASVTGSTFTGNSAGGTGDGGAIYITGPMTASLSRFVGNTATNGGAILEFNDGAATVTNNWWGCNAGPGNTGCDVVTAMNTGTVSFSPWAELSISGTASSITLGSNIGLTVSLNTNSASQTIGPFAAVSGDSIAYNVTGVTDSPALTTGTFAATGTDTPTLSPTSAGAGSVSATFDNQAVSLNFTVDGPPTITSANSATFTVGSVGSFTVAATGFPLPTFSETGALPSGVTFSAAGVLSGTPAANSGGVYVITITASNGTAPNATQTFTLTVDQAPAITSANSATFTVGAAGAFTVTGSGYPAPTFSKTGALPSGVTLTAGGALSGTPAANSGGVYVITITASNGTAPNATQSFTLTVDQAPAITSANSAAFTVGAAGSFTVTAGGYPAPTFSETGALPSGVTLSSAGVLSGTPAIGSGGTYTITITASNGVAPNATQSFTLTVTVPQVQLTTAANPAAGGTVTPPSGLFNLGAVVPLTATPNAGYAFISWSSSPDAVASPTSASTSITMNAAETVTAQFGIGLVVSTAADDYGADSASNCTPQSTPGVNTVDAACSLRDAIDYANTVPTSGITFSSAVFNASNTVAQNTIVLGGGALTINGGTVTITGPASGAGATLTNLVTINGNLASTDFAVGAATATFNNLNIVNGKDSSYYLSLGFGVAGGVFNNGGTVTINGSTISGNVDSPIATVYVYGGGVLNYFGTMTVANSTISGNSAVASYSGYASYGGAILNDGGSLAVTNSTLSGNSATAGSGAQGIGGGIANDGPMTITGSTLSLNATTTGAGGIYDLTNSGTNPVANSIISGNIGPLYPDLFGEGALQTTSGDQITTGFALAPLGNYGGPTQTQPPLPGDPSICGGLITNAVGTTDQRGFGFDPHCSGSVDSGAVQTNYALGFAPLPLSAILGQPITPAPTVTLYERGVLASGASGNAVTLSDTGSTLAGTLTQNLSSGSTSFPGVSFTTPGLNTQLMATIALNATLNLTATAGSTITASPVPAVIATPAPSTTLPGPAVTFSWNAVPAATGYSLWIGSTGVGSNNLYHSGQQTVTSIKVGGLPINGETIYVRLYTNYNGVPQWNDYTFTASQPATLTGPAPSTTLAGPNQTFTWTAATGPAVYPGGYVLGYSLWLGSGGAGTHNLYDSGEANVTTVTAYGLPTDGSTIYARLYTIYNGVAVSIDYQFTAASIPPAALTSPAPSSVLPGSRVTFTWSATSGATGYSLWLGTTQGGNDVYNSHLTAGLSATANNLPTNGETIYARLYTNYNGKVRYTDYTYTAAP